MSKESIIERYLNCEVEVHYKTDNSQFRDRGTILECDGAWFVLQKPASEILLVPIDAVRIIKPLGPAKGQNSVLLRPAPEPERDEQRITPNT